MMWTTKEIVLFLTGVQTFHTLSHIFFAFDGVLPIKFYGIKWTKQMNFYAILINVLITAGLFWWLFHN